jgi:hypothetical protein
MAESLTSSNFQKRKKKKTCDHVNALLGSFPGPWKGPVQVRGPVLASRKISFCVCIVREYVELTKNGFFYKVRRPFLSLRTLHVHYNETQEGKRVISIAGAWSRAR